jgi:hypothetical protein
MRLAANPLASYQALDRMVVVAPDEDKPHVGSDPRDWRQVLLAFGPCT